MDSIIEALYEYFKACPLLDDRKINADYLPEEQREYTIDSTPTDPIVKRYVDGSTVRQYVFAFGSREPYGLDVLQNITNSGFYEAFARWLDDQNRLGNLPVLGQGQEAIKITAQTTGYLFAGGPDTARYQIQCRLTYYQEGN